MVDVMPRSSTVPMSSSLRRISLALGIVLIGANLRAPITSIGPLLPDIQSSLGMDDVRAGLLNGLPLVMFSLLSLVAPKIGHRHGLERILGGALVAILAGTLLRSVAFSGAIWLGTAVLSAGIAFGNVLLPGLLKREFPAQTSGLIGLYAAAMAGTAGLAAGLAVPLAHLPGWTWRWSTGCWAILTLLTLAVWLPHWRDRQHFVPSPAGSQDNFVSPWRHPIGWQVSIFFALHSLVFYSLIDWFASYALTNGVPPETAGVYLLVYQVVAIATNLACGQLIRRLNDQSVLGLICGLLLLGKRCFEAL